METPRTGTQVGQYILEEKLGEGGMAEVWRARNTVLGHSVAMKFLTKQFAGNADVERRFLDEGKRQAMLQHRNIVSAFDFLYVDGRSFLVMKYINGEGLDSRLFALQAPMPLPVLLSISRDVLGALDYAHAQGIVHRDIKPSNILVEPNGCAYVLDFGIALALGQERVTRAGVSIGTPHYMSPEQIMGSKDLNHRTDIYSYGCVLYQMLTETPPFDFKEGEGDTEYFVKDQHLRAPARPLRQLNSQTPPAIERVVLRCLEKKADDRFQSCQELLAALEAAAASQDRRTVPLYTPTVFEQPEMPAMLPQGNRSGGTVYSTAPSPPVQKDAAPLASPAKSALVEPPQTPTPARGNKRLLALASVGAMLLAGAGGGYWWYSRKPEPNTVQPSNTVQQPAPAVHSDTGTAAATTKTSDQQPGSATGNGKTAAATKLPAPAHPKVNRPPAMDQKPVVAPPAETGAAPPTPAYQNANNVAPPPPNPAPGVAQVPQSGVLQCSSAPIGNFQGKQGFLFRDLPRNLQFPTDFSTHWLMHAQRKDEAHQDILLIPMQPGVTSCEVPWRVRAPS